MCNTMNLYRIIVLHAAPKDSHTSTETYLVAESEEAVAEWINKEKCYGYWFGEDGEEPSTRYADGDYEKEIPFREWVMLKRGDLKDPEGWEDAYYGVTKWGWEPIAATPEDIATLLRLGIAITCGAAVVDDQQVGE
jgi:hypothetical protein